MADSCLQGLVGVRGCGTSTTEFNVNDLTGITIPDFDNAISVEKKSAYTALTDLVSFATKEVEQNVRTYLGSKFQLNSFIENGTVGYFYDNKEEVSAETGHLVGFEVRVDSLAYLKYFLHSLQLFVKHNGDVDIHVYDLIQGKLLDTITVTAVSGEIVSVICDKEYSTKKQRLRLFIGYHSTFESYKSTYLSPYSGGDIGCSDLACGWCSCNGVYYRAAKINNNSPKIQSSVESNTYCAGLSLNYSLQCSITEYMCNARNMFALPILYKAGEKVMMEMKHSKRLTGVVTFYGQSHEDLMMYYKAEHERSMAEALQNFKMPEDGCFNCSKKIYSQSRLP